MLISNYEKFQADLREYDLSLDLFNKTYEDLLNKVLNIKKVILENIFINSVEFSNNVVLHNKYSSYVFPIIKKYIDIIVRDLEEMFISTDIIADYSYLLKIKESLDELLDPYRLSSIEKNRNEITNVFFSGILENIKGYEAQFGNKNVLKLFFRSRDIVATIEKELNTISTDGLYETYTILYNECIFSLGEAIYIEELASFETLKNRITMCNSKVKHSIMNCLNFEDRKVNRFACNILDNLEKLECFLTSFFIMETKENRELKKLDYYDFKDTYEGGVSLLNSEHFSNLVFGAKSTIQYFLANYKEFYDLNDEQQKLVTSVNKTLHLFEKFLSKYIRESSKSKVGICETIKIKKDVIFKEFDLVIGNNQDVDYFINKTYVTEVASFEEVVSLIVKDIKKEDYEFAIDLEKLLFGVINSMKITGVDIYLPSKEEKFNSKHHIIEQVVVDPNYEVGEIIKTIYNGYKKDNRVILQARVLVCSK